MQISSVPSTNVYSQKGQRSAEYVKRQDTEIYNPENLAPLDVVDFVDNEMEKNGSTYWTMPGVILTKPDTQGMLKVLTMPPYGGPIVKTFNINKTTGDSIPRIFGKINLNA